MLAQEAAARDPAGRARYFIVRSRELAFIGSEMGNRVRVGLRVEELPVG